MSDTKCHYCQAEKYDNSIPQTDMAGNPFPIDDAFLCGSSPNFQTELCREREAHNQTKRERDEAIRKGVETRNEVNELAAVINELTAVVKGLRVIMRQEGEKCSVCTPEQKCWECADDVSQECAK